MAERAAFMTEMGAGGKEKKKGRAGPPRDRDRPTKPKPRQRKAFHKQDLGEQIEDPSAAGVRAAPRPVRAKKRGRDDEEEGSELVSAKMSGRILKAAREQQEEIDAEEAEEEQGDQGRVQISAGALAAALQAAADSDGDEVSEDEFDDYDADAIYAAAEEEVDPNDEAALAAFMAPAGAVGSSQPLSLGDLILSKLRDKQREAGVAVVPQDGEEEANADDQEELDEKVVQVYRGVGKLLSRYTVGKIPKAFKIIPNLKNWEDVLYLTDPETWSPQAMFEATKLFVSSLNTRLAQRFLALVLLPRLRRDIRQNHKLHVALFQAMKKAAYKPGAFYKGLLLPLASSNCSLREAFVFSSILKRTSIPVLHSAAALLRLAQMEYSGTTSFFIRTLLDKKYALPYRVIDALVDHFVRFADDEREMPVVWHQCMLCFVQRYKDEVRPEDRGALRKLCSQKHHYQVSPEVVRELDHSRSLGGIAGAGAAAGAAGGGGTAARASGDDAMQGVSGFGAGAAAALPSSGVGKHVAEAPHSMPPVVMMDDD